MANIYDFKVARPDGSELNLADNKGKVMVIVNTATGCGFTPQYEPLESMYRELHDSGLEIVDIPCNQFAGQAPGSDDEIHEFCTLHYNTKFPQMKKSDVNGENQLEMYRFLKQEQGFQGLGKGLKATGLSLVVKKMDKDYKNNPDIKWNFTKFVVDRNGNVVARFEPTAKMEEVEKCVASLM